MNIRNSELAKALSASGWTQDRDVDIDTWVVALEAAGYVMNRNAREVLRSLGGLTIEPLESEDQVYKPSPIVFDPMRLRWLPRLASWERALGMTLSPLGECYEGSSLYIGEDDRLYANWDALVECLGEDFEDSLATLVLATKRGHRLR